MSNDEQLLVRVLIQAIDRMVQEVSRGNKKAQRCAIYYKDGHPTKGIQPMQHAMDDIVSYRCLSTSDQGAPSLIDLTPYRTVVPCLWPVRTMSKSAQLPYPYRQTDVHVMRCIIGH